MLSSVYFNASNIGENTYRAGNARSEHDEKLFISTEEPEKLQSEGRRRGKREVEDDGRREEEEDVRIDGREYSSVRKRKKLWEKKTRARKLFQGFICEGRGTD